MTDKIFTSNSITLPKTPLILLFYANTTGKLPVHSLKCFMLATEQVIQADRQTGM